jgi:membrane-bound metal-dependent hydrolase YbcI (DUF457 family)
MPFTPFHFGVGAGLHAAAPERVSFIAFCATNVLVDFETLYYLLTGQFPLHRFFHSFVGVTIVIFVTIALAMFMLKLATRIELPNPFDWQKLTLLPVVIGSVLGGYSHVVLDGVMHPEIRPFAPFAEGNPFYSAIGLGALHWFCVIAGLVGLAVLWLRERFRVEN